MAQLWKQLKQREKSRKLASQVKRALGKENARGGLTQVEAPATQEGKTRERVFSKDKLERACLEEARWRFTQAATTPLLQNIPKGLDSMSVGSAEFLQILEGTYPTHNKTDPFVIKLLKQLKNQTSFRRWWHVCQRSTIADGKWHGSQPHLPYPDCISDITWRASKM